ncbi:Sortase family protein [Saccharopolyspora kobensis]|uniref:Sortase family protein n=2 Tax=Saccharopolyspora kobensis TaxID=146035 RepID=A0A1H6D1H2_9PSEU|nr:class F sortase [Saccharopolyspora kobensis]SEG79067.1 Sortase family protein [Saccharopolyspora kobensis]SFD07106.1 Sortase family protein [Saccharopolyspora kobensis]
MTARRRSLFVVLAVAVIALVAVAVVVAGNLFTAPTTSTAADQPAPPPEAAAVAPQALPAQPVHVPAGQPPGTVRLPQGGTAELVRKEIDRSGTLPVPDGVDEATWWGAGLDAPKGATVLAGHVNWKGAIGPFEELWEARTGQPVTVVDDAGKEWRYQVSEVVTVHKDDLPARARDLFGQGGEHRLVLVTCGGRYVGGDLGYDENRIVIATPA